jgi:hypothetical protein
MKVAIALPGTERDDAADGVVRRNAHRHTVARYHLYSESAHPAAQLGEHFMAGVALNTVEPAGVHGYHRALHID